MAVDLTAQSATGHFVDEQVGLGEGPEDLQKRQLLTTNSWQVVSIPANATPKSRGSRIGLTRNRYADVALNVYKPHRRDEMHCHPGSEHIFMCWQGTLTIRGINEGEEVTMHPGEIVHVKAGHYYQLCNDTDEIAVLYQVATNPPKKSPIGRRSFRRAGDVNADDINKRGLTPEMELVTVWS
jgi:quercetin dioxygenase-like cupin family protein